MSWAQVSSFLGCRRIAKIENLGWKEMEGRNCFIISSLITLGFLLVLVTVDYRQIVLVPTSHFKCHSLIMRYISALLHHSSLFHGRWSPSTSSLVLAFLSGCDGGSGYPHIHSFGFPSFAFDAWLPYLLGSVYSYGISVPYSASSP